MARFPADESSPGASSKEIVLSVLGTHANPARERQEHRDRGTQMPFCPRVGPS